MTKTKFQRFKEGLRELTPTQLLHAKMVGHIGAVIGLFLAMITMFIRGVYYFLVFLFFICWLQAVEYKKTRQQWENSKRILDLENIKELEGL